MTTAAKWDRASRIYDFLTAGEQRRLRPHKRRMYSNATGRVLLVGCGTGADFDLLPRGLRILAIDVSRGMIAQAASRASGYFGELTVREMDVQRLELEAQSIDTVLSCCVFCSVDSPGAGLAEVRRVLKPGGRIFMLEHVRSRIGPLGTMQDICTFVSRRYGPSMNRDTVGNVLRAGFRILREENLYLDILKWIEAAPH